MVSQVKANLVKFTFNTYYYLIYYFYGLNKFLSVFLLTKSGLLTVRVLTVGWVEYKKVIICNLWWRRIGSDYSPIIRQNTVCRFLVTWTGCHFVQVTRRKWPSVYLTKELYGGSNIHSFQKWFYCIKDGVTIILVFSLHKFRFILLFGSLPHNISSVIQHIPVQSNRQASLVMVPLTNSLTALKYYVPSLMMSSRLSSSYMQQIGLQ